MAWRPSNMTESEMFKPLTDEQEKEFREYARNCDPDSTDIKQWSLYHPVCREEWEKRGIRPCQ